MNQPLAPAFPMLLTCYQAAAVLRVSHGRLHALVREGALPCFHHGAAIRIRRADIDIYMQSQAVLAGLESGAPGRV